MKILENGITPINNVSKEATCDETIICHKSTKLFSAMKPFLYSMKAVGLHHHKEFILDDSKAKCEEETGVILKHNYKCKGTTASQVYSLVICTLMAANVVRMMTAFITHEPFNLSYFLFTTTIVSWSVHCLTNGIASFLASHRFHALTEFFLEYEKYDSSEHCLSKCRKKFWIYTIITWTAVLFNMAASYYMIFMTSQMDIIITPFQIYPGVLLYVKIVYMFAQFYLTCAWAFPMAFILILCSILYGEFSYFNKHVKSQIILHENKPPSNLQEMRKRHLSLCKLVSHADDFLSITNGFTLGIGSLQITINLYSLIWNSDFKENATVLASMLFWTIGSICFVAVICIGGAMVNNKAHELLDNIFDITYTDVSKNEVFQIQLFLAKLNGPPVGLTALKMFVIDKPTILTILGLLVTYFVIIVQFSPVYTNATAKAACNCTEYLLNGTLQCRVF